MCVCTQAFGTTFCAAALQIADLLYSRIELRFPSILGHVHVFAVQDVVDRVCAVITQSVAVHLAPYK